MVRSRSAESPLGSRPRQLTISKWRNITLTLHIFSQLHHEIMKWRALVDRVDDDENTLSR